MNAVVREKASTSFIRPAHPNDLPAITQILSQSGLPVEGLPEHFTNFLVVEVQGQIRGTVGLEIYGRKGLIRSLAVDNEFRGRGWGRKLLEAVLSRAREKGLTQVYLLTETAANFFTRFGFSRMSRHQVDAQVAASPEFVHLCPSTATCMSLRLINFGG